MSLLEDVFLENEANEAQELERVIEGDEFDERPRSRSDSDDNSEREDEAEEEKKRVDPASTKTRRVIKNPRFTLNPARLTGPRGIQVIPEHFKDFKFKGKGHEKEDLDLVLKKLEHWAYRLYPKFKFEDCLKKIETLGKKRPVMVHLHKIRTDQYVSEETVVQRDSSDDEAPRDAPDEAPPEDEFDKLLQQQIELARSTPAPSSVTKGMNRVVNENRSFMTPKATSSPSISDEQRERILKSRKLAEERRLARLKNVSNIVNITQNHEKITDTPSKSDNTTYTQDKMSDSEINKSNSAITENNATRNFDNYANTSCKSDNTTNTREKVSSDDEINNVNTKNILNSEENLAGKVKKVRTNVIDSSDEDDTGLLNEPIRADVHKVDSNENHTNNIKQGPKQTDAHTIDDDEVLEMNVNYPNNDQKNDSNSDEDNIVLMNESIRVDVHKADSDKGDTNAIKQKPKLNGHIDDDVIIELNGNSQENSNLVKKVTVLMNKAKSSTDDEKQDDTTVHGLENSDNILEIDKENNDKRFDSAKIDNENDMEMISITEKNTNDNVTCNYHEDMTNNEKSAKISSQEIRHVPKHNSNIEESQEAISDEKEFPIEGASEKAVENNIDDLMDVEFDDDF